MYLLFSSSFLFSGLFLVFKERVKTTFVSVKLHIVLLAYCRSAAQGLGRAERQQLYRELTNCLDVVEPVDGKPIDEVVGDQTFLTLTPASMLNLGSL